MLLAHPSRSFIELCIQGNVPAFSFTAHFLLFQGPDKAQELSDDFVHACDDARWRDIEARRRKQVVLKRTKPAAFNLTDAFNQVIMTVAITVSKKVLLRGRSAPGMSKPLLSCASRMVTSNRIPSIDKSIDKYHANLRLQGLIYKLDQENAINMLSDTLQFYLRREKRHTLTAQGVIFEAVKKEEILKSVGKSATTAPDETLRFFLAVAPSNQPLVVVTAGFECSHTQLDVGEVITKCALSHAFD